MGEKKTFKLEEELLTRIRNFKIHPRQPDEEILAVLITRCEEAQKKGDLEIYKKDGITRN